MGSNKNSQRRRFEAEQKELRRREEEAMRERLRKESADRIAESKREEADLLEKIASLRKQMASNDQVAQRAFDAANKRKEVAAEEIEILEKKTTNDARLLLLEPKKRAAALNKKVEENIKLIQLLKRDNQKLW